MVDWIVGRFAGWLSCESLKTPAGIRGGGEFILPPSGLIRSSVMAACTLTEVCTDFPSNPFERALARDPSDGKMLPFP